MSHPYTPSDALENAATTTSAATIRQSDHKLRRGIALGMASAVAYSAANLALRGLSGRHDDLGWSIWVTAVKALPTAVIALALLTVRWSQSRPLYPTRKPIPALFVAGLVMQFGGNLGFQVALGHIGLAITVPLVFAFIIFAGAVFGKIFLGDTVSRRMLMSMVIMTVSIILLSWSATLNQTDSASAGVSTGIIWLGIVMAVISGLSYGVNGVVIRSVAQKTLPIESMLIIYSSTGLLCLGSLGFYRMGWQRILEINAHEWQMMLCAGVFNAFAFFSLSNALKLVNISRINVINASQNAMCAVGAVVMFAEPLSAPMVAGIVLSMIGLIVLDRK